MGGGLPRRGRDVHADEAGAVHRRRRSPAAARRAAETGPFYCPVDRKVYIDLDFFKELRDRFGAQGDFAQAYVDAHEVGHHVQQQTGIAAQVRQLDSRPGPPERAVREDRAPGRLPRRRVGAVGLRAGRPPSPGDIDEGLQAASAVGDDRIQASAGRDVNPETWTHGSAEQRSGWFNKGYTSGDPGACDTFAAG